MRSIRRQRRFGRCRMPEGPTRTGAIAARWPWAGAATMTGRAPGWPRRAARAGRRRRWRARTGPGGQAAGNRRGTPRERVRRQPRFGRGAFDRRRAPADHEPRGRQPAERERQRRGPRCRRLRRRGRGRRRRRRSTAEPRIRVQGRRSSVTAALDQRRLAGAGADDRRARVDGGEPAEERQAELALPFDRGGAVGVGQDDDVGVGRGGEVGGGVECHVRSQGPASTAGRRAPCRRRPSRRRR